MFVAVLYVCGCGFLSHFSISSINASRSVCREAAAIEQALSSPLHIT